MSDEVLVKEITKKNNLLRKAIRALASAYLNGTWESRGFDPDDPNDMGSFEYFAFELDSKDIERIHRIITSPEFRDFLTEAQQKKLNP